MPLWRSNLSGKELVGGYQEATSDFNTGALNNSRSAAAITALSITSDGVTPIYIDYYSAKLNCTVLGTNPTNASVEIWDGTIGSGTRIGFADYIFTATNIFTGSANVRRRVTLSAGAHTINVCVLNATASASTFVLGAGATFPAFLRATFAGTN